MTEGRYLRFEAWSHALSVNSSSLSSTGHSDKFARDALFVLHWPGSQPKDNQFWILNQSKDKFLTSDLSFSGSDHAATFARVDHTDGKGHSMNSEKIDLAKPGWFRISRGVQPFPVPGIQCFSVDVCSFRTSIIVLNCSLV